MLASLNRCFYLSRLGSIVPIPCSSLFTPSLFQSHHVFILQTNSTETCPVVLSLVYKKGLPRRLITISPSLQVESLPRHAGHHVFLVSLDNIKRQSGSFATNLSHDLLALACRLVGLFIKLNPSPL